MADYVNWIKGLGGKPVFVAYPAGFDFLFVYWYLIRFTGASPFSHSALDMKTYAMALLRSGRAVRVGVLPHGLLPAVHRRARHRVVHDPP